MKPETSLDIPDHSHHPKRVALVLARWHSEIVEALEAGARETLLKANPQCQIQTYVAPGTLEIPQLMKAIVKRAEKTPDAMIALSCIVRGETTHFDLIATSVFQALVTLGMKEKVTITNGILAVETLEQARARAGGDKGNKGEEAAQAALDLFAACEAIV